MRRTLPAAVLSGLVLVAGASGCASRDLLRAAVPVDDRLTIAVVVENPAGSDEKWEVRANGRLVQERWPDGSPLRIPYLPWPVNGGMIPRTLLSEDLGGDGEPLDVLLLGPARPRGSLVRAVPIGLLHVIDRLERDDKILAVDADGPFADLRDVAELEERLPGVRTILKTWYTHSRPGGAIVVQGYGSPAAAARLIVEGVEAFSEAERSGEMPRWTTR